MYSVDPKELWVGVSMGSSKRLVHPGAVCNPSLTTASINSSHGRLELQALRIFDGTCQVTVGPKHGGLTSIWVLGSSTAALFRVMGLKRPLALDESYQLFITSCRDLDSFPVHSADDSPRGRDAFLLALTTIISKNEATLVRLECCCVVYDIHFYTMDRVQSRLEGDDFFSNALHSAHWILHTLHEVVMSNYTAESGYDWIFTFIFPSLGTRTREILSLMILLTESWGQKDVPEALAQALLWTAKNICPDFDPFIHGEYFHLTVKSHEMLSCLSMIWEPRRQGRKADQDLIVEADYARSSILSSTRRQNPWVRLSQFDYEWKMLWSTTNLPVKFRFPVKDILSRMEKTTPCTAMRYAREYCKLRNEDFESFVHRSPSQDDLYVFAEGWGPRLVEELNLAWKFENITIV